MGKRKMVSVAKVRVGDRLLGKGRGVVTAVALEGKYFFDYAPERERSTAPWESFYPGERVEREGQL